MAGERRSSAVWPVVLATVALAANLTLLAMRQTASVVNGDEGTFIAMAESLALDGDLEFDERDRSRIESFPRGGRTDIILQRTDAGIQYSKPAFYAVLASPLFLLLGDFGLVALNAVAFCVALLLAIAYWRQRDSGSVAALAVVAFAGTSVLPAYVAWTMSDSLQASFVLAGAALCLGSSRLPGTEAGRRLGRIFGPRSAAAGALCLGLAAAMRYPNAAVGVAVIATLAVERRRRRALLVVALLSAGLALGLGLNRGLAGTAVPYKALRATFTPETGYPAGSGAEDAMAQFEVGQATQRVGLVPRVWPSMTAWSTLYFLAGRHTGLILYFPMALFLLAAAARRADARAVLMAGAGVGMAAFYLVWLPWNYFGGATFLGNRYFLTSYAALLLAPRRLPGRLALGGSCLIALVAFSSAVSSVARTRTSDGTSQMHANAGVFRLLPYESTARDLDGRRDRYWSDEFVRFVDPYAVVREHGFRLAAGLPASEVLVANDRHFGIIRLLVRSDADHVRVVYSDWMKTEAFELGPSIRGSGGLLEVVPSASWRRHSFWWDESGARRNARIFRLRLDGPADATAEIRYAGPYRFVPRFYRGASSGPDLSAVRRAASRETVQLELRNLGLRHWDSSDAIPVHLGYRLYRLPRVEGASPLRARLAPLSGRLEPGASGAGEIEVRWPSQGGAYEIVFDLAVGGVLWFSDFSEAPLASAVVEIAPGPETTGEKR
jgi:hypothetical protein